METKNMDKVLIGSFGVLIAMAALVSVVSAQTPQPPPQDYICPIDGLRFGTYEELYQHFVVAHPTTPIEIVWE